MINKAELQKVLTIVKPALANKEVIEQSTSFAFMNNKVITYNDEIAISHPLSIDIEGVIQANELYSLLSKTKDEEIKLTIKNNEVFIKGKRSKAYIKLIKDVTLPYESEIGKLKKWQKLPENFINSLKLCIFVAGKDKSRVLLTGIHLNEDYIEACDNYRTIRYTFDKEYFSNILFPATSAKILIQYNVIKFCSTKGWIHFATDDKTVFSCRVFEDEYPDMSESLKGVKGTKIIFPDEIKEIINRAEIFSKDPDNYLDEEIKIIISKNKMVIKSEGDFGRFEEKIKIDYDKDKELEFNINPQFLYEALNTINSAIIGKDRLMFKDKNFIHVVSQAIQEE